MIEIDNRRADPAGFTTSAMPPSKYADRFSVDSVVFGRPGDPGRTLGASQVMVGRDYPYPLAERPVGQVAHRLDVLDDGARAAILGGNAGSLLSL